LLGVSLLATRYTQVARQKKKNERRREKYWAEMQSEAMVEYDYKEIEKVREGGREGGRDYKGIQQHPAEGL